MADYVPPQDIINSLGGAFAAAEHNRRDPRRYGGYAGGAQDDMNRYRTMAGDVQNRPPPVVDKTRSNQTRGIMMGGLGMVEDRARGGWTPAQQLAHEQTRGAVYGLQSQAASIRGGAMARAAAARQAQQQTASVAAQGYQDQQALRAREMADAAGTFASGATTMRGQDLGVAGEDARLNMGQRGLNDQSSAFFENLGFDVGNQATNAQLGGTAQDNAAITQDIRAKQQQDAESLGTARTIAGAGVGAAMGGLQGWTASQNRPRYPYP